MIKFFVPCDVMTLRLRMTNAIAAGIVDYKVVVNSPSAAPTLVLQTGFREEPAMPCGNPLSAPAYTPLSVRLTYKQHTYGASSTEKVTSLLAEVELESHSVIP